MESKPYTANLKTVFAQLLTEQLAAEKKYIKHFEKISKTILTKELKSAISADGTDIENHISRLSLTIATVKKKPKVNVTAIDEELLNMLKPASSKDESLLKDIQTLHTLKLIFNIKVARYESLYHMATALGHEEYAILLDQCSKDNQNTFGYLNQIAQNILYPNVQKITTEG